MANNTESKQVSTALEEYALIGDAEGAGLISRAGSLDWLCMPRFDSGACFAALLGRPEHGRWLIAPQTHSPTITRRYQGETFILETLFETPDGEVALIDCMSLDRHPDPHVPRVVEGRRGSVPMRTELILRFDYGHIVPWVTRKEHHWSFIAGPDTCELFTDVPLHGRGLSTVGEFVVRQGDRVEFALTHHRSHLPAGKAPNVQRFLAETRARWQRWSDRSTYRGVYPEAVQRSLLVLKALTYEPTGAIVAAPTTSLPERLGGTRNWDYRLCWLRDATITLNALMLAGYKEEATAWREWLLRAVAGSADQVRAVYGIAGEHRLTELELSWLPGYEASQPVRTGNAAHSQLQLDVFGELMDAMHQCRRMGLQNPASWALERSLLGFLEARWHEPDESIWEVRAGRRQFTYSKVMAWVAFDRAVKAIQRFDLPGPLAHYEKLRDEIHRDVCAHGFSRSKGAFAAAYGHE